MQMALTGFLEKNTGAFVEELWTLLIDAQSNAFGIPSAFLERKKQELASKTRPTYVAAAGATSSGSSTIAAAGRGEEGGERRSRFSETAPASAATTSTTATTSTSAASSASDRTSSRREGMLQCNNYKPSKYQI